MAKDFKSRIRNPLVQQYLFEIVLPFAGYFFFDWSLMVIGVYYLLDQFVGQVLFFRRYLWIENSGKIKRVNRTFLALILISFIVLYALECGFFYHYMLVANDLTAEQFYQQLSVFAWEELWLLVPVMFIAYHMMDQFSFYMPRRYLNYHARKYAYLNTVLNIIILCLLVVGGWIWETYEFSDEWVLIIFVAVKVAFDLLVQKIAKKKVLRSSVN